jgi:hypothetical protein
VAAGALVLTPAKSKKMRGGPSSAPTVGEGSGPSASIVTTTSLPSEAIAIARTFGDLSAVDADGGCAATDDESASHAASDVTPIEK